MGGEMTALGDRTLTLVCQGYRFSDWLDAHVPPRGDVRTIRLLGRRTLVLRGRAGVELFYDIDRVSRRRAVPGLVSNTLFGKGAVHGLDGDEHHQRKQLFLDATAPDRVADLAERVGATWDAELDRWTHTGHGTVFPSAVRAIGVAVQEWAGLGAAPVVMRRRAWQLVQIVDGFGVPGLPYLRARLARRRAEAWARRALSAVRRGDLRPPSDSLVERMAVARDLAGDLLPLRTAAVELLNVLRPTVAVSYFVMFAARELEANPDLNDACADGDPWAVRTFSDEVRRMTPFVPVLGGRTRHPFTWHGLHVRSGDRLLLDVYGTNHEAAAWQYADTFDPGRFRSAEQRHRPDFIPQGGGPVDTGHRCPGEGIALSLLEQMVPRLARLDWRIHPDDRDLSLSRMPARPDGGVRLLDVRPTYYSSRRS
jgi:fatty-acid peroxygenase